MHKSVSLFRIRGSFSESGLTIEAFAKLCFYPCVASAKANFLPHQILENIQNRGTE